MVKLGNYVRMKGDSYLQDGKGRNHRLVAGAFYRICAMRARDGVIEYGFDGHTVDEIVGLPESYYVFPNKAFYNLTKRAIGDDSLICY